MQLIRQKLRRSRARIPREYGYLARRVSESFDALGQGRIPNGNGASFFTLSPDPHYNGGMKRTPLAVALVLTLLTGCTTLTPRWTAQDEGSKPTPREMSKGPIAVSVFFPQEELALWRDREQIFPRSRLSRALETLRRRAPTRWKGHWEAYCPRCEFRPFSSEVAGIDPTTFLEGLLAEDATAHLQHWAAIFGRTPVLVAVVKTSQDYRRTVHLSNVTSQVTAALEVTTYWIDPNGPNWVHRSTGSLSDAETYARKPAEPQGLEWLSESLTVMGGKTDPEPSSPHWDRAYPYPSPPNVEQWLETSLRRVAKSRPL